MAATTQDPFSGKPGPFSQYLDPSNTPQAVQWDNGQQPSGYQGKTGNIAFLGTKLLQGITQGRISAFAKKEQQKMQTFGHLTAMMEAIRSNPDVSPEVKASIEKQYAVMLGKVGSSQVKESGAAKDKGVRGNIASTLGSVFDKMAGGPFKGDPLNVEDMSNFMATATKAIQGKDSTAASSYDQQQQLINQGMQKAQQAAQQAGRKVVTIEDVNRVPEIQQALRWYGQYAPEQLKVIQSQFSSLPSHGTKEWAGSELAARTTAPPAPRAQQAQTAQPGGGYLATQDAAAAGAPPVSRGAVSPDSVARQRPGPPEAPPQHEEDEQVMEQLREIAGIGPKPVRNDIPRYDSEGHIVGLGSKDENDSYYRSRTVGQGDKRIEATAAQRTERRKEFWEKFSQENKFHERSLNQADRRIQQGDQALGIRGAEEFLRENEFNEKKAPQAAMSKLVQEAARQGVPFKDFADHAGDIIDGLDDPGIKQHEGYILDQVSRLQQRKGGGDWESLMAAASGKKPAADKDRPPAPPAARAAKPQTQKPDVKKSVSRISKGLDLGLDDDDAPPATPAPRSGSAPASATANPY